MQALRQHVAHHPLHMAVCSLAVVFVIAAGIIGVPLLAVAGAVMCGTMMIGMVWMMVRHGGHHH